MPNLILVASLVFGFMTPFVFVAMRRSVKNQRRQVINDLAVIFAPPSVDGSALIPSFEFVKFKYFLPKTVPDGATSDAGKDFPLWQWGFSLIPLGVILSVLNGVLFSLVAHVIFDVDFPWGVHWLTGIAATPTSVIIVMTAYLAAYLFMIRAFLTAINNFDLGPLSFIGAFINLLAGMVTSLVFVYGVMSVVEGSDHSGIINSRLFAVFAVGAFAVGYLPNIAIRNVIKSSKLSDYKREDDQIYKSFSAIPVEVIDGIDSEIRERLSDFHIGTVQNLAAANPLMLFVETPYGVYQVLDWVAQAQLCCSVGPTTLLKLWPLGIRTIFDLERSAFDPACRDPDFLMLIGTALFAGSNGKDKPDPVLTPGLIEANIRTRLNDSHVHRLRQLYNRIDQKLGDDAKRLPPILSCSTDNTKPCPFVRPILKQAA